MNYLGSKTLETKELILKAETMKEQKRLWELLMQDDVSCYYFARNKSGQKKLHDWYFEEQGCRVRMMYAHEPNVFNWSIFLKQNGLCIGKIGTQQKAIEKDSASIHFYLGKPYQKQGYMYLAAQTVLSYLLEEVLFTSITASVMKPNSSCSKLLEKLNFEREESSSNEMEEEYHYILTRNRHLERKSVKTYEKKNI